MAKLIARRKVKIEEVLDSSIVQELVDHFENNRTGSLSETKAHFKDRFSYGELQMAYEHWMLEKERAET